MNSAKFILAFVIVHPFMLQFTNEFSLRPKNFKVERAGSCKPALRLGGKLEKFDLSQPTINHFHLDADIRILADVTEPVQFHMKYVKCTLDSVNSCDDHETMKFDNVCDRLSEKNAIWTPLLKIIKPKMSCPIKKGVYTVRNGTFDLSMISRLPVDGFKYVTTISLYETFKNGTQPLQLLCFDSEVVVSLQSSGRPRGKG